MSTSDFITQDDVAKVAEIAVEPSYISEIARKLQKVDETYGTVGYNAVVRMVARAVQALEDEGRVDINRLDYGEFGGQKESSPITSIIGESFAEGSGWQEYTVVRSTETGYESVREKYRSEVNPDVTLSQKIEQSDFISRMGKRVSILSEEILEDVLRAVIYDADVFEVSDYNNPGADAYIQGFEWKDGTYHSQGYAIEVSIRWENSVGVPYMDSKINKVMDLEKEHGEAVDLIVMAPSFTGTVEDRYEDGDVVRAYHLPESPTGFPVITADYSGDRDRVEEMGISGPDYPVVGETFDSFIADLETVNRDYHVLGEMEYRNQIVNILEGELSG